MRCKMDDGCRLGVGQDVLQPRRVAQVDRFHGQHAVEPRETVARPDREVVDCDDGSAAREECARGRHPNESRSARD